MSWEQLDLREKVEWLHRRIGNSSSSGGGGAVSSVFGRTGIVAANANDYALYYLLVNNNPALAGQGDVVLIADNNGDVSVEPLVPIDLNTPLNKHILTYDSNTSQFINVARFQKTTQVGTSYPLTNNDIDTLILFTNNSDITLTVPAGLRTDFNCAIAQLGTGKITFTASSTTILNVDGFTKTRGAGSIATILCTTNDSFITQGAME